MVVGHKKSKMNNLSDDIRIYGLLRQKNQERQQLQILIWKNSYDFFSWLEFVDLFLYDLENCEIEAGRIFL